DGTTYSVVFDSSSIGGPLTGTAYNLPAGYITSDGQYRWNMATHNAAGYGNPNASRYYFTEDTVTVPPPPSITSVGPVVGSNSAQPVTVNGDNFVNKPTITLTWPGQPGYTVPPAHVTYINKNQLQMS